MDIEFVYKNGFTSSTKNTLSRITLLGNLINRYVIISLKESIGYFIKELLRNNIDLLFENKDLAFRYNLTFRYQLTVSV